MSIMMDGKFALDLECTLTAMVQRGIVLLACLCTTGMSIQQMLRFVQLINEGDKTIPARCELLKPHQQAVEEYIQQLQRNLQVIASKLVHYQKTLLDKEHVTKWKWQ